MISETEISVSDLVQRISNLLDSAAFDTTYKLATLEGLVLKAVDNFAYEPSEVVALSARDISSHVLQRYWDQSASFSPSATSEASWLRQRAGGQGGDLVSRIVEVRTELGLFTRADTLQKARNIAPNDVATLEDVVWERVVDMPIPLLQRSGSGKNTNEDRFIYEYAWSSAGEKQRVALARKDDTLTLKPGVANGLQQLQPLLIRLIELFWVRLVADWNPVLSDAGRLYEALFGSARQSNTALAAPLLEMQGGKCFYCDHQAGTKREVDHFLPWSITRNDRIENLVVACKSCNSAKSDALVAVQHLTKWRSRLDPSTSVGGKLTSLAELRARGHDPVSTLGQARSLYFHAPESLPLWIHGSDFIGIDKSKAKDALS